jgi:hypothetical protein
VVKEERLVKAGIAEVELAAAMVAHQILAIMPEPDTAPLLDMAGQVASQLHTPRGRSQTKIRLPFSLCIRKACPLVLAAAVGRVAPEITTSRNVSASIMVANHIVVARIIAKAGLMAALAARAATSIYLGRSGGHMGVLMRGECNYDEEDTALVKFFIDSSMPFYKCTATKNFPYMGHILMNRDGQKEGVPHSDLYPFARRLVTNLLERNGVKLRTIYRMAVNLTFSDPSLHGDPHKDHDFPHNNLLIYLNDFDEGYTFIFDDKNTIIDKVTGKKDTFVIFDGCRHAQGFCKPQQTRIALICTFDGDVPVTSEAAA